MHLKGCVSVTCTVLLSVGCGPTGVRSIPTLSAIEAQPEIRLGEAFVLRVEQTATLGGGVGVGGHVKVRNFRQASTAVTGVSVSWSVAVSG